MTPTAEQAIIDKLKSGASLSDMYGIRRSIDSGTGYDLATGMGRANYLESQKSNDWGTPIFDFANYMRQLGGYQNNINQTGLSNILAGMNRMRTGQGNMAMSNAYAQNMSNPYAAVDRASARSTDAFAPQFGQLNESLAGLMGNAANQGLMTQFQSQVGNKQSRNQALLQLLMGQIGAGAQQEQADAQKFGIEDILPGLLSAGGSVASAYIGKPPVPKV